MVGHYLPNKVKTCYNTFFTFFRKPNAPYVSKTQQIHTYNTHVGTKTCRQTSTGQFGTLLLVTTSMLSYLSGGGGQNWPDGIRDSKTNEQQIRTRGISDLLPSQGQGDPKIAAARNRPVMSRTSTAPDCPKGRPKKKKTGLARRTNRTAVQFNWLRHQRLV
jgi:hypothetical protein